MNETQIKKSAPLAWRQRAKLVGEGAGGAPVWRHRLLATPLACPSSESKSGPRRAKEGTRGEHQPPGAPPSAMGPSTVLVMLATALLARPATAGEFSGRPT